MGHYAAEMQCDSCGMLHCRCPSKPDPNLKLWVVDEYEALVGAEFLKKYKHNSTAQMSLMFKTKHKNKKEAVASIPGLIEDAIRSNEEMVDGLQKANTKLREKLRDAILQVP